MAKTFFLDDEKNKRIKIAYMEGGCYMMAEIKLSAIIKTIPFAVKILP